MNILTIHTKEHKASLPDVETALGGFSAALQREQPGTSGTPRAEWQTASPT